VLVSSDGATAAAVLKKDGTKVHYALLGVKTSLAQGVTTQPGHCEPVGVGFRQPAKTGNGISVEQTWACTVPRNDDADGALVAVKTIVADVFTPAAKSIQVRKLAKS